ncbi:uncharacterized protein LOC133378867 [Rhineura floridana]|uniref:uncharacterized protein LOC133378867 n=1 Tax=Rhineura floridana TaxID=261503 RepID=UPI002AC81BA5|nr:uncharacterized protein LOC133378867 [Rhineura floridana]
MADLWGPVQDLCEEATCSICLEYFWDPVIIPECGHNFCRACLRRCWGKSEAEASCPQCRERVQRSSIRPNRQLADIAEIARKLSLQRGKGAEGKGRVCEKHQEPLKLFCKDDEAPICVVCDRSKEHKDHEVIPLEEASQEYKDQISGCLDNLRQDRERILTFKADTEKENQDLLKQTESEREKMMAEFRRLHQFLEVQEQLLLAEMEEVEKEIAKERDEHLARLSEELSSLESVIQEMEDKRQQPASELLQDIGSFLQRSLAKEEFQSPSAFPPDLKWRIWDFCDINPFLEGVMKQFRDTLGSGLQQQKENVTLDPDTAHPMLILSVDHKSVRYGNELQNLPDNPERFDEFTYVLGREGFTTGRHFWEVLVGCEPTWTVGVARKSVKRKGVIDWISEGGIWEMEKWSGEYSVSTFPGCSVLSLSEEPKRIRVTLNYEGGRVAFYDADRAALLYAYPATSFSGETLQPLLCVCYNAHLTLLKGSITSELLVDLPSQLSAPKRRVAERLFAFCCHPAAASPVNKATETPSAMASAPLPTNMEEEAKCPICLEWLKDPVTVDCGHNFCRVCITNYCDIWEEQKVGDLECPMCKTRIQKGNFRPNWQLANIVENLKLLPVNREGKDLCDKHKERLHLFCKEDKELVCMVCLHAPEHRKHSMLTLEEAAKKYKGHIWNCLDCLRKTREKILGCKDDTHTKTQDMLMQTKAEKERMVAEFRQLHQFLEEQEKFLLAQMEEVEKEIAKRSSEHLARLYRELSSLERIIWDMEEKFQQPASEFLQDIKSFLQRSQAKEKIKSIIFPPDLKWRIWDFCDINLFLEGNMKQFRDNLESGLQLQKEDVSLDPGTAHPRLILSKDHKSVRFGKKHLAMSNSSERFETYPCVLGREKFTAGRHFWEVHVGSEETWAVGVARKSVKRKGKISFGPKEGIWEMGKWPGEYRASFSFAFRALSLNEEPKRIRVTLNCEGGRVAFYDADRGDLLYAFPAASFPGETLQPFFYVFNKAQLTLSA